MKTTKKTLSRILTFGLTLALIASAYVCGVKSATKKQEEPSDPFISDYHRYLETSIVANSMWSDAYESDHVSYVHSEYPSACPVCRAIQNNPSRNRLKPGDNPWASTPEPYEPIAYNNWASTREAYDPGPGSNAPKPYEPGPNIPERHDPGPCPY